MNFRIRLSALDIGIGLALCAGFAASAQAEKPDFAPQIASNESAGELAANGLNAKRLRTDQAEWVLPNLKGWDFLYDLLREHGEDPRHVAMVLSDPRMPARETLYFNLEPRESASLYRKHNTLKNRRNAIEFFNEHRSQFYSAARMFGVPPAVILALIQVETHCGQVTGNNKVFHRLARLAAAAAPDNIDKNYEQKRRDKGVSLFKIRARAQVLQATFLPHVAATLKLASSLGIHPLEVRGSGAGAIGIPQFLPGNVTTYGVDADGDGRVNLYSSADAIHSVGRFLKEHGWKNGRALATNDKRRVIRYYNRSEPYVSTVLSMAAALEQMSQPLATASVSIPAKSGPSNNSHANGSPKNPLGTLASAEKTTD